jgi:uncharacterized protein (TIRG00374 family)
MTALRPAAPQPQAKHTPTPRRRTILISASFLMVFALLYVVLPAVGKFGNTYALLRHATSIDIIGAIITTTGTFAVAAITYKFLALHSIRYGRTLLVQISSSFANRVLPAGTGGLALNIQYLRKSRHSTSEASVVAAVNNGLGLIANLLVLGFFLILYPGGFPGVLVSKSVLYHLVLYIVIGLCVAIVGLLILSHYIDVSSPILSVIKSLKFYKKRSLYLLLGLVSSICGCLLYASVLYFTAHSLGVHLTLMQAFLAMTLSTIGSVLIPTPGGVGGAEAGVVSALVAIHIGSPLSLAVALLYRVFTFWIPLIAGALVFRFSLRYL